MQTAYAVKSKIKADSGYYAGQSKQALTFYNCINCQQITMCVKSRVQVEFQSLNRMASSVGMALILTSVIEQIVF